MKDFKIMGISLPIFATLGVVLLIAIQLGVLPTGMIGALALMMFVGALLDFIGNKTPIVKDYFGGGPIVIIFASAALVYFKILPPAIITNIRNFMETGALRAFNQAGEAITVGYRGGFLDFYIAALITGSILGMNRKLLIKAAVRFLPAIFGGVVVALGLVYIVGLVMGYGGMEAIYYVGIPIMGGGMGAGAVPLSQIFGEALGVEPATVLSKLVPAVALGNALAIVAGGLLDKLGKIKPEWTGNGRLLISNEDFGENEKEEKDDSGLAGYGIGILIATTFFAVGAIIGKFVPDVHPYAWMIIAVGVVKAFGFMPRNYELYCQKWFKFVAVNFTPALLVGIGIAYTNLGQVIEAFSLTYLVLVTVVVIGAIIGSAFVGRLVGFYPIEAAITAGLCMANMGGTGDVAVLSTAKRMELMPFAQISSRIGGALMLLLASGAIALFGG
ncbi:MAG: 2-hydroxycarboxylate transporter family protein [Erysipelothrix sp.]|nr:2-hydroxycarboxylate transporter family protein [Erysipelothrix sp.]